MVIWIPSIDCEREGEIKTERHDGPRIINRARVERGKSSPPPVALKPETKVASAGLALDNETGDY